MVKIVVLLVKIHDFPGKYKILSKRLLNLLKLPQTSNKQKIVCLQTTMWLILICKGILTVWQRRNK